MCHFNGDICHLTGILELGLCCQLRAEGVNTDQVLDIRCLNVPESVYMSRERTVVYQIVNHMFVSPYNESFIYTSVYSFWAVTDSE